MPDPFQFQPVYERPDVSDGVRHVIHQRRLARLLAFTGRSIDDVVNCGIAKREIAHYFKTDRLTQRRIEVLELERQWNPLGRTG